MRLEQVAAQLYTVRRATQTPRDFAETIRKLRAIGYPAVELSGLGPMPEKEIRRALDSEGMVCCASHEAEDLLFQAPARVVERLHLFGCKTAVLAWPGDRTFGDGRVVSDLAEKLNRAGAYLMKEGFRLAYHHHHMELTRLGRQTALEFLFERTDPRCVAAELDTYWLQYGGVNPAAWCRRMAGRLTVLHLKDYAVTSDRRVTFAEVGAGNLDWEEILAAADEAGCEWFAVEQDECAADPFDALRLSFEYLRARWR
jgi:sugar phosphate isomerase/epimerase